MDTEGTLAARLSAIETRFDEITAQLAALNSAFDPAENKRLSKERAQLESVVDASHLYKALASELSEAEGMTRDTDPAIVEMARSEVARLRSRLAEQEQRLRSLLVPKDPNDDKDIFI